MREMRDSGVEWIGDVPASWTVERFKGLVSNVNEPIPAGSSLSVPLENVEPWTGKLLNSAPSEDNEGCAKGFRSGDVLFSKLRPYLAKAYCAPMPGACSGEMLVLRTTVMDPRFLLYYLLSPSIIDVINGLNFGAKMPRADWNIVCDLMVPLPPMDAQRRIVAYLDERCAAIDEDVAKRREVIEKLKEYKKSLIARAVTKGLDPNAEMKDSGVEWIGEVPTRWTISKLSFFANSVLGKMIDRKTETAVNIHRYLSNRDVNWFCVNSDNLSETSFPENSDQRYGIEDGDILICEGGEVGRCCVWRGPSPDFYFQKAIHRLRVNQKIAVPEFIAYQMLQKSVEGKFIEVRHGEATISHLPGDQLMMLKFILPPLGEQRRIVAYLDECRAVIDEAISRQKQLIDKLGEYRKSIIHHAVTGKIDCREA